MSWGVNWGSGGSSGGSSGSSGSGWGSSLPSSDRNTAVARDLGGRDGLISEQEFGLALEDLGMKPDEEITETQAESVLTNLGFGKSLASSVVDGMVEEFPDGFTGNEFLLNIFAYDADKNGLSAEELGKHNEEVAKLAKPSGWGTRP